MKTGIIVLGVAIFLASCNSKDKKKDTYEQSQSNIETIEEKYPDRFIAVSGYDKKNLLGQTVVKGLLTNNAKVVSYKDIDVELSFFSRTGTLLEKDHEVIYEIIAPGESKHFKTKYFAPKGTDSVALTVLSAKVEK